MKFRLWLENDQEIYYRYIHNNGQGLINNQALDRMKLSDEEEGELVDLLDFGLQQPIGVPSGAIFVFTPEGVQMHQRLLQLLKKASKFGVRKMALRKPENYKVVWQSTDGQIALMPMG